MNIWSRALNRWIGRRHLLVDPRDHRHLLVGAEAGRLVEKRPEPIAVRVVVVEQFGLAEGEPRELWIERRDPRACRPAADQPQVGRVRRILDRSDDAARRRREPIVRLRSALRRLLASPSATV